MEMTEPLTIMQCLFCLNENHLFRMIQSFRSIESAQTAIHLDGWFATTELYQAYEAEIVKARKQRKETIVLKRRGINCGKAFILHTMNFGGPGFVLYLDCDLILIKAPFILPRLRNLAATNRVTFLNQQGDNRHHACVYENPMSIDSDATGFAEVVCAPPAGIGIAGGAWIARTDILARCSYPMVGIYAPDDAVWVAQLVHRGVNVLVCTTISVQHPPETDQRYARHKHSKRRGKAEFNILEYIAEIDAFHREFG